MTSRSSEVGFPRKSYIGLYLFQRIRGYFYNEMRYINLRFTYLLTLRFYNTQTYSRSYSRYSVPYDRLKTKSDKCQYVKLDAVSTVSLLIDVISVKKL